MQTERAAAEAARESAESARESAEEAREQALASYIEGAGLGVKTGSAAPSMSGLSEPGRIYHRLTTGETFIRENGGGWLPIAYERPWETVSSFTLNSSCSAIEIGVSSGGAPFAYDELRLTYVGSMHSSAVVGVYVNGYASAYVRDSAFALTDPSVSGGCATVLRAFRSSAPGFIETERRCGGIADTNGSSATKALHTGFIKPSSASALTAIKLAALSGGSFVSGATVILEGRNGL
ncbi:MAG: hypothetical protein J6P98_04430 [Clostridia bacterium]|nr:hypothetical protein [Clostridia bacterium]